MRAMTTKLAQQVTLYTRPGCHLCEDAADLLDRLGERFPLRVTEVNILNDVDLFERYKHSIPVVAIAGGPTLRAPIGAAALERALAENARG
jgi:glutaredoxin